MSATRTILSPVSGRSICYGGPVHKRLIREGKMENVPLERINKKKDVTKKGEDGDGNNSSANGRKQRATDMPRVNGRFVKKDRGGNNEQNNNNEDRESTIARNERDEKSKFLTQSVGTPKTTTRKENDKNTREGGEKNTRPIKGTENNIKTRKEDTLGDIGAIRGNDNRKSGVKNTNRELKTFREYFENPNENNISRKSKSTTTGTRGNVKESKTTSVKDVGYSRGGDIKTPVGKSFVKRSERNLSKSVDSDDEATASSSSEEKNKKHKITIK